MTNYNSKEDRKATKRDGDRNEYNRDNVSPKNDPEGDDDYFGVSDNE